MDTLWVYAWWMPLLYWASVTHAINFSSYACMSLHYGIYHCSTPSILWNPTGRNIKHWSCENTSWQSYQFTSCSLPWYILFQHTSSSLERIQTYCITVYKHSSSPWKRTSFKQISNSFYWKFPIQGAIKHPSTACDPSTCFLVFHTIHLSETSVENWLTLFQVGFATNHHMSTEPHPWTKLSKMCSGGQGHSQNCIHYATLPGRKWNKPRHTILSAMPVFSKLYFHVEFCNLFISGVLTLINSQCV